jgi:hypothetical protein
LAFELLENLEKTPEGTIEADLADLAVAWVIGSDMELGNIILMEGIIFRARHGALGEKESDVFFVLKHWRSDLAWTAFVGTRPGDSIWQEN